MDLSEEAGGSGQTGLYRLYDAEDTLLYVGIASNPRRRWAEHARDKRDAWWPQVNTKEVEWFGTREAAEEAELTAILAERPRHNAVGSIRNEHGARVKDGMARKRLLTQLAAQTTRSYQVTARRGQNDRWLLEAPALPGVQATARRLQTAEETIRHHIAQALGCDPDAFTIQLHLQELSADVAEALRTQEAAQRSAAAAAQAHRSATAGAVNALLRHFSLRDTGRILGIAYQRVQQVRDESPASSEWELPTASLGD